MNKANKQALEEFSQMTAVEVRVALKVNRILKNLGLSLQNPSVQGIARQATEAKDILTWREVERLIEELVDLAGDAVYY